MQQLVCERTHIHNWKVEQVGVESLTNAVCEVKAVLTHFVLLLRVFSKPFRITALLRDLSVTVFFSQFTAHYTALVAEMMPN